MESGAAPIAEASTIASLRQRRWSHRQPASTGLMGVLTAAFWALWLYLVLPLLSLVLWAAGVKLFVSQATDDGYQALLSTLVAYSSILLGLVGLLAIWIFWNVARYGGSQNRRTVKRPDVTELEAWQKFRVDHSIGESLRVERFLSVDLDDDGCVVVASHRPRAA